MSTSTPLTIPQDLLEAVYREARASFPEECCGWLVGPRDGSAVSAVRRCDNSQSAGRHPIAAERGAETAYVLSATDLLELNRTLDGDTPPRIIYHSHPNGQAYFSPTDQQVARDPWGEGPAYPVQQLVVGLDGEQVVEAALFDWSDEAGEFVAIARFPGASV